jgi:hypothetical protein
MRVLTTILAGVSALLLCVSIFFFARSYVRFEGSLHFTDGNAPLNATASDNGQSRQFNLTGRSSGWISFRGQLTYFSIGNFVQLESWESWSIPTDAEPAPGPMMLAWEARDIRGVGGGSGTSKRELRDPAMGVNWRLPYSYFTIPYWMLVVAFGILPMRWFLSFREASRRQAAGLCVRCGARVAGLTGACPKCGEPIPS